MYDTAETSLPVAPSTRRAPRAPLIVLCTVVAAITLRPVFIAEAIAADKAAAAPVENPLRTADEPTRVAARTAAWTTFQRSCRPCHGSLGGGDGPFNMSYPKKAADLRRPSREVATDAVRFARIRDGAAALAERSWESNMPAFGDDLDADAIWGLVLLLQDLGTDGSGLDQNATGADIYAARCSVCHGATGAGDGPLAAELLPVPTNFQHGAYRLRSTEYGEAPLDSDIIGATAHGVGNTAMGRFLTLGSQRLEDVSAHVMSLNSKLFATTPKTLTSSPIPIGSTVQLAARGRVVYDEAKCGECHGPTGRGNGPSAAGAKDDEGHPALTTNLTKRWTMKLGSSSTDIFRTLTAGLNGTPMKSYATLSGDDRWALAHYVDRIGRIRPRYAPTVQAAIVTEPLPLDPNDPFWKASLPASVAMAPQIEIPPYWTQPSIDVVDVAAAVNDDQLGIMLTWDDRTRNVRNEESVPPTVAAALARHGTWRLTDAIAIEFPDKIDPKGSLPPSLLGDAERSVRRWYWSAERQERGEAEAVIQTFGGPRTTPGASTEGGPVQTNAVYADGQWRMLMIAKRPAKAVASMPIALQAWDGGAGESGTWQSVSAWVNVTLR